MDKISYLPLGSIVIIKGGIRKVVVIARGIGANINGELKAFDYGGCLYPEGLVGENIMFFNHAEISKTIFEGFKDTDEELMVENIQAWAAKSDIKRGDPFELNKPNTSGKP